jgi:hypothetical protein
MEQLVQIAATSVTVVVLARGLVAAEVASAPPVAHFVDGAPSIDVLLADLLAALATNDEQALHRLRVNEHEYRTIISRDTVERGESEPDERKTSGALSCGRVVQEAEAGARELLARFGGHAYARRQLTFTNGIRQCAGYTAHGDVWLTLLDEYGERAELRTGTIAQVEGQYKFIGFSPSD